MAVHVSEPATSGQSVKKYTMREVRSASQKEWDSWLQQAPGGGHIFQSYAWSVAKRDLGWKPVRLVLERDGELCGAAQFLVFNTPTPGTLMYAPKGPWIPWDDEEAVRTFFGGVRTVAERENAHTVKIEPETLETNTTVKDLLGEMGFRKARYDLQFKTTMIVDLHPSEDEILARMKHKTRYNIRLAARKGVEIVEDNSQEALDAFFDLMRITAERDGYVLRPREYFMALWQTLYDGEHAHLFFATHEGQKLAGMLVVTFGGKYWYLTGASSNEQRKLMPTYLLQWEVMKWAKQHGITYYDMVAIPNPDSLNEQDPMWGLYRFKSGFGGDIAEFVGCYDLPIKQARAWAWYNFEPIYYRIRRRIFNQNYY